MPRVDVWDLAKARETPLIDAGFDPMDGFDERCVCSGGKREAKCVALSTNFLDIFLVAC
jgi:hypothetical protein